MDTQSGNNNEATFNELSSVVPQFAQMLAEAMHADRCAIFAYAEDQQSTIALFRYGYDDVIREAHSWTNRFNPAEIPAEAHILQTKQPLMRSTEEDFAQVPLVNTGQERREGRLTDLVVPLIWEERVQGVAYVWRTHDPAPYSSFEIQTAMDLGQLVAMTVVFSRQYESERVQRQRLDTLLNVASIASSGQRLDDVLQVLAGAVRSSTGADVCSLYVLDQHGRDVIAAYEDGLQPDEVNVFIASQQISVYDIPVEVRLHRTLEPEVIHDFDTDLASCSPLRKYALDTGIAEILVLPITWQQRVTGFIYCWYRSDEKRFSQRSIEMAEGIARQAGGVVTRARLEETIHRQTVESEALLRIGQAVLTSDRLEPVLDEISGALYDLVPFDYCYVGTLTADEGNIQVIREWGTNYNSIVNSLIPVNASLSGTAIRERKLISTGHLTQDPRAWQRIPTPSPLQAIS
ncbi:MAG: GAF domain-containing protein, partial [Thermomicrobiaceae bacterium]